MNIIIGKSYKIIVKINNVNLTYTCKITDIDDTFISFVDKFNKEYNYNKNLIVQIEEVKNG